MPVKGNRLETGRVIASFWKRGRRTVPDMILFSRWRFSRVRGWENSSLLMGKYILAREIRRDSTDNMEWYYIFTEEREGAAYGRKPATYTQSGRKKGHALPSVSVECQWMMLPARAIISITAPRFDRHGPLSAPPRALQQSPSNRISSWTFPFSIAVYHPPSHGKEMSFNVLIVACGTWIRKKGWAACFNPHGNSPGRSCPAVYFPA